MKLSSTVGFDSIRVYRHDTFTILDRARGWRVVRRDTSGPGQPDLEQRKQGWVPAGCLLETSISVAPAIATTLSGANTPSNAPIMPSIIVSTSYPGVALSNYRKKEGKEELDIVKDDELRVFKRYNHWSYVCLDAPFFVIHR